MKSKKVITLSLSDLKDLGIIPRKTTNKKKNEDTKRNLIIQVLILIQSLIVLIWLDFLKVILF